MGCSHHSNLFLCLSPLVAVFWNSSEHPLKICADYPCNESTYLKFSSSHTKLAIQVMKSLFLGLCIHPSGRSCLWEEMLQNAGRSSLQQGWDFWSCCKPCQPCPSLLQHSEDTECKLIRHCQCRAALGIPGKWRARHFCTGLLCFSLECLESFSFSALLCRPLFVSLKFVRL